MPLHFWKSSKDNKRHEIGVCAYRTVQYTRNTLRMRTWINGLGAWIQSKLENVVCILNPSEHGGTHGLPLGGRYLVVHHRLGVVVVVVVVIAGHNDDEVWFSFGVDMDHVRVSSKQAREMVELCRRCDQTPHIHRLTQKKDRLIDRQRLHTIL